MSFYKEASELIESVINYHLRADKKGCNIY